MTGRLVLGIETSCDETAASVVADGTRVISDVVASQVEFHRRFGGVVPEIASRKHLELVNAVVEQAMGEAGLALADLAAIAVTEGPGLVGALLVGMATAKGLGWVADLDVVGVNHIEAHIYANFMEHPDLAPPFVCLVVSGGHTSLVYVPSLGRYEIMGSTLDDAAGEAYDKIAAFLGLGYPGGPAIDALSDQGDAEAIRFPRAMIATPDYDFSLSGLKTAVLNYVKKERAAGRQISVPDVAAGFQAATVDVQVHKLIRAAKEKGVAAVALSGGVACNTRLRRQLAAEAEGQGLRLYYPSPRLCTDNATMIAGLGFHKWKEGRFLDLDAQPDPNLTLPA